MEIIVDISRDFVKGRKKGKEFKNNRRIEFNWDYWELELDGRLN